MIAATIIVSCLIAFVSTSILRTGDDWFSLTNIAERRHLGFGVISKVPRQSTSVQFYDVDFASQDCTDFQVQVYRSGYLQTAADLVATLCDPKALQDFSTSSNRGIYVNVTTSDLITNGQIKARFQAQGGTMIVRESYQR